MQMDELPHPCTASSRGWEQQPHSGSYSTVLLILHLVAIPALLVLPHHTAWYTFTAFSAFYLLFTGWQYTHSLKKLRKSMFWLQLLLILVLA